MIIYGAETDDASDDNGDNTSDDQSQKKTADVGVSTGNSPETVYKTADVKMRQMTSSEFCDPMNTRILQESVMAIVDQEAPLSADVLSRELIALAGISKVTPKLRERCSYLIKSIEKSVKLHYTSQKLDLESDDDDSEVIFLWKDGTEIGKVMDFYRVPAEGGKPRKAPDIPVQEAACAARYLAESQYGMPYESLITETCKALGFARAPEDSDNYRLGKRAVDYCIRQQLLIYDDDGFVKMV